MALLTETKTLLVDDREGIVTLTFHRPEHMNCFNNEMAEELAEVTDALLRKKDLRALCLRGHGRLFMAGGDIAYFASNLGEMPKGVRQLVRLAHASFMNLHELSCPIVACTHGSVAGIGISFVALADLAIAAESTQFTTAYGNIGLTPDGGSTFFLPRLLGPKKAMELTLFPDLFSAQQAEQWGLINWVVPDSDLENQTQKVLHRLASGPRMAIQRTKALIRQSLEQDLASQLEAEAKAFANSTGTQDFRRGVTAFLNKERPTFQGD